MPPKFFPTAERHTQCSAQQALFSGVRFILLLLELAAGSKTPFSVHLTATHHHLPCLSSSTCSDIGWHPTGNSHITSFSCLIRVLLAASALPFFSYPNFSSSESMHSSILKIQTIWPLPVTSSVTFLSQLETLSSLFWLLEWSLN